MARRMLMCGIRLVGAAICAWALLSLTGRLAAAEPSPGIQEILEEMAEQRGTFDPRVLDDLGAQGLEALLDHLLPDTAADAGTPEQRELVAELIRQLGDERFAVRERATARLIEMGSVCRTAVATAAEGGDPEARFRARRILAAWRASDKESVRKYAAAFAIYAPFIQDSEQLTTLARRTAAALQNGMPEGGRMDVLGICLETLARNGKDEHTGDLIPLVRHDDIRVAVLVTQRMGLHKPADGPFPRLLLAALESDREAVVAEAIAWSADCKDEEQAAEIKRLLRKILNGDKQALRLQAAISLLSDYYEPQAVQYLVDELRSMDEGRVNRALAELGKTTDVRFPAAGDLLAALFPLLKSEDDRQRLAAANAVGSFAGESVVQNLIPLLDDRRSNIIRAVARKLQKQPDQEMLRRVLREASEDGLSANTRLQNQLNKLLK